MALATDGERLLHSYWKAFEGQSSCVQSISTYITSTLQDAGLGDPGWPESQSDSPDSSLSCAICLGKCSSHSDTLLAYLWNDDDIRTPGKIMRWMKHLLSAWHTANILCEPPWLKYRLKSTVKSPLLGATLHQEPVPQELKMQGFMINMVLTFKTHLEKTSNVLLTWMQGSVSFCPFQRKTQDWMPTAPLSDISRSSGQTACGPQNPISPLWILNTRPGEAACLSSHNAVIKPCISLSINKVENLFVLLLVTIFHSFCSSVIHKVGNEALTHTQKKYVEPVRWIEGYLCQIT